MPDVAALVDFVVQQMLLMLSMVDLLTFDSYRMIKLNCLAEKVAKLENICAT